MKNTEKSQLRSKTVLKRLRSTEEGKALLAVLELVGGRTALCRAAGLTHDTVHNWITRGRISKEGAVKLESMDFFRENGFSRQNLRPDLTQFQWGDV